MARPNKTDDIGATRWRRLLTAWRGGTSQHQLARQEGCSQPRIHQMLRKGEQDERIEDGWSNRRRGDVADD